MEPDRSVNGYRREPCQNDTLDAVIAYHYCALRRLALNETHERILAEAGPCRPLDGPYGPVVHANAD